MRESSVPESAVMDSTLHEQVTQWRRHLHQNPELSLQEHETAAFVCATLQALGVSEETLTGQRRALGEDHPSTLVSANNLALSLKQLGEYERARDLDEDTLARRRSAKVITAPSADWPGKGSGRTSPAAGRRLLPAGAPPLVIACQTITATTSGSAKGCA